MNRILFLMNDQGSPPGVLWEETVAFGAEPVVLMPYKGLSLAPGHEPQVPDSDENFSGLVILGGVMSANDVGDHPCLEEQEALIRAFHDADKPVLGICLGAQLIAKAFGRQVPRLEQIHWGFLRLEKLPAAEDDPLLTGISDDLHLLEWHLDTFEVPENATLLLTRQDCPAQGFRLGRATYGFQGHLELTLDTLKHWTRIRATEAKDESPEFFAAAEAEAARHYPAQERFARNVMRRWLALA